MKNFLPSEYKKNEKLKIKYIENGLKYSLRFDKIIFRKKLLKFYEERYNSIYNQ